MTIDNAHELDTKSDDLISILVDQGRTRTERTRASQQLYQQHTGWVVQQISRNIYNPEDVQDIAQAVWMQVLQPDKLARDYKYRDGKFRAYLRAPIRWAILKHIDQLPFTTNDAGEKTPAHFIDIDDSMLEECLDKSILDNVIENIIKPNLKLVDIKSRNVYVVNDYDTLFENHPSLEHVATLNGMASSESIRLLHTASQKAIETCSDEEIAVYFPINYSSLVDPSRLKKSSGRYLSGLIGVSEAAFRKRLHSARKFLLETVRQNLFTLTEGSHHG